MPTSKISRSQCIDEELNEILMDEYLKKANNVIIDMDNEQGRYQVYLRM